MSDREWRLIDLLNAARDYLEKKGLDNPRGDAEALLGKVLNLPRIQLYLQHDRPMKPDEIAGYRGYLSRRVQHEPLQLLLGSVEFLDTVIHVAPGLLIPRPETEELAELAVTSARESSALTHLRILDLGTGTGCIAIAIATHVSTARVDAIDIDFEAVKCATANAKLNNVTDRVQVLTADLFSPRFLSQVQPPYDMIVSNPPYVAENEFDTLPPEVKHHESRHALAAGPDGLDYYRRIADLIPALLNPGGKLLLEIGESQGTAVRDLFSKAALAVAVHKDLSGRDRFVIARSSSASSHAP